MDYVNWRVHDIVLHSSLWKTFLSLTVAIDFDSLNNDLVLRYHAKAANFFISHKLKARPKVIKSCHHITKNQVQERRRACNSSISKHEYSRNYRPEKSFFLFFFLSSASLCTDCLGSVAFHVSGIKSRIFFFCFGSFFFLPPISISITEPTIHKMFGLKMRWHLLLRTVMKAVEDHGFMWW